MSSTIKRAIDALAVLERSESGLRVSDLASALKMSVPSASRLLQTLRDAGFVQRDPTTGDHFLGTRLWTMGAAALKRNRARTVALPLIASSLADLGNAVNFVIAEPQYVVGTDHVRLQGNLAVTTPHGIRAPYHASASGKAILARSSDEFVQGVLERGLRSLTPATITDKQVLLDELATIREQGFALGRGEFKPGGHGVSAAILDANDNPVAAIHAPTDSSELESDPSLGPKVVSLARLISEQLGYRGDLDYGSV